MALRFPERNRVLPQHGVSLQIFEMPTESVFIRVHLWLVMKISAIILAAGLSRRAAPHNKLLLPHGKLTVVRSTVEAVCAADCSEWIVVTGHQKEQIEAALAGLPVRFMYAADFEKGMGHSLAAGVAACSRDCAGFLVSAGDLSGLKAETVRAVARHFMRFGGRHHVIPVNRGRRGHPVVIGGWLCGDLCQLSGDTGARRLLDRPGEKARTAVLEVDDPGIWRDVDRGPPARGQER